MSNDVPRLDLADPTFDTTGPDVHAAREQTWWAHTPYGFAVLRHAESAALLRDRRFIQGNARWPEQNGIHSGLFHDWWAETLLSLEGGDHDRVRRLLLPAFRKRSIEAMRPSFTALAEELIDGFAARGQVELVAEFAEPYAARIICRLLGLDEEHWPQVAHWADDLGASFSIDVGAQVPRIEAALDGLSGYLADVVADRRAHPREDFVTTLVQAADDPPEGTAGLTDHELSVALVFLVFAGMETTRNQIGLAVQTLLGHPDQWRLLASRPDLGSACVEEVMRVNPTVTWVTREARRGRRPRRRAGGARGRGRAGALPRRRHRPDRDGRPGLRPRGGRARRAPAAHRVRRRHPPLPGAHGRPGRHGGGAAAAGAPDARRPCRRTRRVDARLRQHRRPAVPAALHPLLTSDPEEPA